MLWLFLSGQRITPPQLRITHPAIPSLANPPHVGALQLGASSNALEATADETIPDQSSARPYGLARQLDGSLNQPRTALPINSTTWDTDREVFITERHQQEVQRSSVSANRPDTGFVGEELAGTVVEETSSGSQETEFQNASITVKKTKQTILRKGKFGKRAYPIRACKPPRLPEIANASSSGIADEQQAEFTRRQLEIANAEMHQLVGTVRNLELQNE